MSDRRKNSQDALKRILSELSFNAISDNDNCPAIDFENLLDRIQKLYIRLRFWSIPLGASCAILAISGVDQPFERQIIIIAVIYSLLAAGIGVAFVAGCLERILRSYGRIKTKPSTPERAQR
ncbi:hypothetical protein HWD97_07000 [Ochrobactrum sp. C6C9]|uniref:hypothetical protein n=1 Tax=Ochrobactrum sp. C6C9 TaxID=2736662 RepID=UPI00353004EA|nr:hypothetical protein [Ochrobactrum sp. C6C9]